MPAKRNDERRKRIMKLRRAGKTYREIARIEGIHHSTVYQYVTESHAQQPRTVEHD